MFFGFRGQLFFSFAVFRKMVLVFWVRRFGGKGSDVVIKACRRCLDVSISGVTAEITDIRGVLRFLRDGRVVAP